MKYFLFGLLIISCISCDKLYKDEELTLTKQPYTGDELKTNGYYYSKNYLGIYPYYILYRNGVILHLNGHDTTFEGMDLYLKKTFIDQSNYKNRKSNWGLFRVNSKEIVLEAWYYSGKGNLEVYKWTGEVINDTTIHFFKSEDQNGHVEPDDLWLHYREFMPKPDSVNTVIP